MTDQAISIPVKNSKKEIRKVIQEKLSVTLADYKSIVGEKKFNTRIKKAARSLGADIVKALPRKKHKEKPAIAEKGS